VATTVTSSGEVATWVVLGPLYDRSGLPLVARFGTGAAELGLRLVVDDSAAYTAALIQDEADRSAFGAELVEDANLTLTASAATALSSGHVDARLMAGLAGAASSALFTITRFTGTTGDLDNGNIFRQVTLTDITDRGPTANSGRPAVRRLADFSSRCRSRRTSRWPYSRSATPSPSAMPPHAPSVCWPDRLGVRAGAA